MSEIQNIKENIKNYRTLVVISMVFVLSSSIYLAFAILGIAPAFDLGLIHLLAIMVALPNFFVFVLLTYQVIDWRYKHSYKFFTELDPDGQTFDIIAIEREAMDNWSFTDAQSIDDATRDGPHSEYVMHTRRIDKDEKIIEPAGEKIQAPSDDEVIASPEEYMREYRESLLKWALKYRNHVLGKGANATETEINVAQQIAKSIDDVASQYDSFEFEETASDIDGKEDLNDAVKRLDALEERLGKEKENSNNGGDKE